MSRKDMILTNIVTGLFGIFLGVVAFAWMVLILT
jgi:hypothetical protein